MPKLNQIIAIEKSVKSQALKDLTALYHVLQKAPLLTGISRVYRPKDDEGDQLPPESTRVQVSVADVLREVAQIMSRLFDVVATKDFGNMDAMADVVVDGDTLLTGVPVTHLLFLEKQLTDLATVFKELPTLDPSEHWEFDESQNVWASEPVETTRTKKVPRAHVLYEATPDHPAQVETYHEDVIIGYWRTIKFSGAISARQKSDLIARCRTLQAAVKFAREAANATDVASQRVSENLLDYLFDL